MTTYLDKVLALYPDIQHVVYWQTKYDGTPWDNPYDGLIWENKEIPKPTKEELDVVVIPVVQPVVPTLEEIQNKINNIQAQLNLLSASVTSISPSI